METIQTHSKAKLALGVITSPSVAFEEILRRQLLGEAFLIPAITGTLAMVAALLQSHGQGHLPLFSLGHANPVTYVGLMMLYGLLLHFLLKWLGTESDYRSLLTVMGWAQVPLAVSQFFAAVEAALTVAYGPGNIGAQYLVPAMHALNIWFLPTIGIGIRAATNANLSRGIMSYMIVHLAAFIGFTYTYGNSRLEPFRETTAGIFYAAQLIVQYDTLPWLAAGFVGLAAGLWFLGKTLEWDDGLRKRRCATAAILGIAVVAGYYYTLWKTDYYGDALAAARYYAREKYSQAAQKLEKLMPVLPGDSAALLLEIGDLYYSAGDDAKADKAFRKALKSPPPALADRKSQDARARVGLGMVDDIRGDYDAAIKQFEQSAKLLPKFREPWARSAVTRARMGDYDKAIEAGNHAVKTLKSEAPEAYLALTQAYTVKGDDKQAKASYKKLQELDKDLAKRVGPTPADWKNAVSKLTRKDLVFPLEKQIVQPQDPPQPKKPAATEKK